MDIREIYDTFRNCDRSKADIAANVKRSRLIYITRRVVMCNLAIIFDTTYIHDNFNLKHVFTLSIPYRIINMLQKVYEKK